MTLAEAIAHVIEHNYCIAERHTEKFTMLEFNAITDTLSTHTPNRFFSIHRAPASENFRLLEHSPMSLLMHSKQSMYCVDAFQNKVYCKDNRICIESEPEIVDNESGAMTLVVYCEMHLGDLVLTFPDMD